MPDSIEDILATVSGKKRNTVKTPRTPMGETAIDAINRIYTEEGADPSLGLAMARQEGGKWSTPTSGAGAQGPLQVIPATGLRYVSKEEWETQDGKIRAAARYTKDLSNKFGGDPYYITAAYHAGEGKVKSYYDRGEQIPKSGAFYDSHAKIYTPDHVDRVLNNYQGKGRAVGKIYGGETIDDILKNLPKTPKKQLEQTYENQEIVDPIVFQKSQTKPTGFLPRSFYKLSPEEKKAFEEREATWKAQEEYENSPWYSRFWKNTKEGVNRGLLNIERAQTNFGNVSGGAYSAGPGAPPFIVSDPEFKANPQAALKNQQERIAKDKTKTDANLKQAFIDQSRRESVLPQTGVAPYYRGTVSGITTAVPVIGATALGVPAPLAFGVQAGLEHLDEGPKNAAIEAAKGATIAKLMGMGSRAITPFTPALKQSITTRTAAPLVDNVARRLIAGGFVGTGTAATELAGQFVKDGKIDFERAAQAGIPMGILTALMPGRNRPIYQDRELSNEIGPPRRTPPPRYDAEGQIVKNAAELSPVDPITNTGRLLPPSGRIPPSAPGSRPIPVIPPSPESMPPASPSSPIAEPNSSVPQLYTGDPVVLKHPSGGMRLVQIVDASPTFVSVADAKNNLSRYSQDEFEAMTGQRVAFTRRPKPSIVPPSTQAASPIVLPSPSTSTSSITSPQKSTTGKKDVRTATKEITSVNNPINRITGEIPTEGSIVTQKHGPVVEQKDTSSPSKITEQPNIDKAVAQVPASEGPIQPSIRAGQVIPTRTSLAGDSEDEEKEKRFTSKLIGIYTPKAARKNAKNLVQSLNDPEKAKAVLMPKNRILREIWQKETGVTLPPNIEGTHKAIEKHFSSRLNSIASEIEQSRTNLIPEQPAASIKQKIDQNYKSPQTVEEHFQAIGRFRRGEMPAAEVRSLVHWLSDSKNEEIFKQSLRSKTVAQLRSNFQLWPGYKKEDYVDMAFDKIVMSYHLGDSLVHSMSERTIDAVKRNSESLTDEQIQESVIKRKAEREAYQKALTNPETKEEFDTFVRKKSESALTAEQRMKYDELQTDDRRERDKTRSEKESIVDKIKDTEAREVGKEVVKYFHTKMNQDVWIVKLDERVSRDAYNELLGKAKKLGGWYSRAWHGSPAGFAFKTEETVKEFVSLKDSSASALKSQADREKEQQQNAVDHLESVAAHTEERADEIKNAERKTNTERRARMAASTIEQADKEKAVAQTIRNIADAINRGEAKHLSKVSAKTHIETLDHLLTHAKINRQTAINEDPKLRDRDPVAEDIEYAKLPKFDTYGHIIKEIADDLEKVKGGLRHSQILKKLYDPYNTDRQVKVGRDDAQRAVEILKRSGKKHIYHWWVDNLADLQRLEVMDIKNVAELRAALREYLKVRQESEREDPIKKTERDLIGRNIPGYFPTPKKIVDEMLDGAEIKSGMEVLEPSAGKGSIADQIKKEHPDIDLTVVERNSTLRDVLEAKGYKPAEYDFLEHKGEYDRIIMNPPFEGGADIDHVKHAYDLLKPGGRIVAIMSSGAFYRGDKKATAFREWLDSVGGQSEKLPEGSFRESDRSTGASTRKVIINKPAAKPQRDLKGYSDEAAKRRTGSKEDISRSTGRQTISEVVAPSGKTARGTTSELEIPGSNAKYPIRYDIRELDDIQPSHDPFTFESNPRYSLTNDRDYRDPNNRLPVIEATQAGAFSPRRILSDDPTASNGPPIVYGNNVLGGNSRTMMLKRVYANNQGDVQRYKATLKAQSESFGIDSNEIDKFKQPILVRSILNDDANRQKLITDLNIQPGKALTSTEAASARARSLPTETMQFISDRLAIEGPEGTLAMALEASKGVNILNRLIEDGVVPQGDRGGYLTDQGILNARARQEIEAMLLARLFRDKQQMESTPPAMKNKLIRVAPNLAKLTGTDWDITSLIPNAIDAVLATQSQKLGLEELNKRGFLFGEGTKYSEEELAIAKLLKESGPRAIEAGFKDYAKAFDLSQAGPGLFGEPMSQEEAFDEIFTSSKVNRPIESRGDLRNRPYRKNLYNKPSRQAYRWETKPLNVNSTVEEVYDSVRVRFIPAKNLSSRVNELKVLDEAATHRDFTIDEKSGGFKHVKYPTILMNDAAMEILREAIGDRTSIRGIDEEENGTQAILLSRSDIKLLTEYLRQYPSGRIPRRSKQGRKSLQRFVDTLDLMLLKSPHHQIFGLIDASDIFENEFVQQLINHELGVHGWQYEVIKQYEPYDEKGNRSYSYDLLGEELTRSLKYYLTVRNGLVRLGYADSPIIVSIEAIAYVLDGRWREVGLSLAEAKEFVEDYLQKVASIYGGAALDNLTVYHTKLRETVERVKYVSRQIKGSQAFPRRKKGSSGKPQSRGRAGGRGEDEAPSDSGESRDRPGGDRRREEASRDREQRGLAKSKSQDVAEKAEQYFKNFDEVAKEYTKRFGKFISTDNAAELIDEYSASNDSRTDFYDDVYPSAHKFADKLFRQRIKEKTAPGKKKLVVLYAGAQGSGKSSEIESSVYRDLVESAHVVLDSNLATRAAIALRIEQALDAHNEVAVIGVSRNPLDAWVGVLTRAMETGRVVAIDPFMRNHTSIPDALPETARNYRHNYRVKFYGLNNNFGKGNAVAGNLANIFKPISNVEALRRRLIQKTKEAVKNGNISERVGVAAIGENKPFGRSQSERLADDAGGGISREASPLPEKSGNSARGRGVRQDYAESDQASGSSRKEELRRKVENIADKTVATGIRTLGRINRATKPKSGSDLYMGSGFGSLQSLFGTDDIKDTLKQIREWSRESIDDVRKIVNPMGRGLSAQQTSRITRERAAELARKGDIAHKKLEKSSKILGKLPQSEQRAFIYAIETGDIPSLPNELQPFANLMRQMLDDRRNEVQNLGTGKLQSFYQNYFPHIWKDPKKAGSVFQQYFGKRPFEGSKSFLKQRSIPTIEHGIALGLEPITYNPVDLVLLKLREIDRYVMSHSVLEEMKSVGLLAKIKSTHRVPDGWAKIDDKVGIIYGPPLKGGLNIRGYWIAPAPAANVINNYLSPGLRSFAPFRAYLGIANILNQFQLGFSFFHFGFTSLDAAISKMALGLQQISYGKPFSAMSSFAQVPFSPLTNILKGRKVYKAWQEPGSSGPEWDAIANAVQAGGGRIKMDSFYSTEMTKRMKEAFSKKNIPGGLEGLFRTPFALAEQVAKPLMEYLVPRQKLGVFAELARLEIERLGPNASHEDIRKVMAKVWDSVDNRMGQLVYDNLFWNKAFKDLLMATVRSVGWNLGTKREVLGGASDFAKWGTNWVIKIGGGGKIPPSSKHPVSSKYGGEWFSGRPEFTYRMGYIMSLTIVTGLVGGFITYLMTGERPKELKDYFFPRTGAKDENGRDQRISLPSYVKDIYHYYEDPGRTAINKLHPALNLMSEIFSNKDFYGAEVWNDDDPPTQQAQDTLLHIVKAFEPFSIRGYREGKERKTNVPTIFPFIGLTPAPASVQKTKAEKLADELLSERRPVGSRTKEEAERSKTSRNIVRNIRLGENATSDIQSAIKAGKMSPTQIPDIYRRANTPGLVWTFNKLDLNDALKVWDTASADEKKQLRPQLQRKMKTLYSLPAEQRVKLLEKSRSALGLQK